VQESQIGAGHAGFTRAISTDSLPNHLSCRCDLLLARGWQEWDSRWQLSRPCQSRNEYSQGKIPSPCTSLALPTNNFMQWPLHNFVTASGLRDDIIQALECLKPSINEEMIHTSTSEVGVTEKMLSELAKHREETEEGGDNVSDRYMKPQRSPKMNEQFLLSTASRPTTVAIMFFFHCFFSSFSAASRRFYIRTTVRS